MTGFYKIVILKALQDVLNKCGNIWVLNGNYFQRLFNSWMNENVCERTESGLRFVDFCNCLAHNKRANPTIYYPLSVIIVA